MNNKLWCVFYVRDYKGGKLCTHINIDLDDVLDVIAEDWDFLKPKSINPKSINDVELWEIWNNWYEHEDRHNAYDTSSEMQVFKTMN